jgi:hypothetical protein
MPRRVDRVEAWHDLLAVIDEVQPVFVGKKMRAVKVLISFGLLSSVQKSKLAWVMY